MAGSNTNCSSITAPIDISGNGTLCTLTCRYEPLYENETIQVQNYDYYISIKYNTTPPKAKFNNQEYNVKEVRIFSKSIHSFSSSFASGEILIIHQSTNSTGQLLVVCIPISVSDVSTPGTNQLNNLLKITTNQGPRSQLSTNNSSGSYETSPLFQPNINFDLINFISSGPFNYYSGTFSFQNSSNLGGSCSKPSFIIVYPLGESVNLNQTNYNLLTNLLTLPPSSSGYSIYQNFYTDNQNILYINNGGALNDQEDDIYIDCQPVDKSNDTVYVPLSEHSNNLSKIGKQMGKIITGPIAGAVIGIIILLAFYLIIEFLITNISRFFVLGPRALRTSSSRGMSGEFVSAPPTQQHGMAPATIIER